MAHPNAKNKTGLTLLERIMIPTILKKETDYKSAIVIRDLKTKVALTQKEFKDFDVKAAPTGLTWNEKGVKSIVLFDLTDFERTELREALKKLNDEKKLSIDHISLYEKFVK